MKVISIIKVFEKKNTFFVTLKSIISPSLFPLILLRFVFVELKAMVAQCL